MYMSINKREGIKNVKLKTQYNMIGRDHFIIQRYLEYYST